MRWLCLFFFILTGCVSTTDTRQSTSKTIIEHHPLADGGFIEKRTTLESSDAESHTGSDIDWGGVAAQAIGAAATGNWATLGTVAATAIGGGALTLMQRAHSKQNRADADEGWAKYEAAMKDKASA